LDSAYQRSMGVYMPTGAPPPPMQEYDPLAGNWFGQTARSHALRFESTLPALEGLGRKMFGDDAGAKEP
jgi:hypothetical protein